MLTIDETDTFLDYAKDTFYYPLYVIALETGLRIGELLGLTWDDVVFNWKVIYVRHILCYLRKDGRYIFEMYDTKTRNRWRAVPLTAKAYDALKKQKVLRNTIYVKAFEKNNEYKNLVFVTKNNRPTQQFIVQECMEVTMRKIQKENPEFERLTPHCLRHTFATRAIERGAQSKTQQKLLGHGSLQMTMNLYCNVTNDSLFEAIRMMDTG